MDKTVSLFLFSMLHENNFQNRFFSDHFLNQNQFTYKVQTLHGVIFLMFFDVLSFAQQLSKPLI